MMTVKDAHMVSKSYIRAWANAKNVVEVLDIEDGRGYPISYKSATVVSYVYDPRILTHDLEDTYAKIESSGIPAINKLRDGHSFLTEVERKELVAFLDMHLDRGRYANQSKVSAPAIILKTDGSHEEVELNLGDLLLLSQHLPEVLRLNKLGIEEWPWRVERINGLATGDGAVLLWHEPGSEEVCTVSFPISPTQLLTIGQPIPDDAPHPNFPLSKTSKRWIIGEIGTLNLNFVTADGSQK